MIGLSIFVLFRCLCAVACVCLFGMFCSRCVLFVLCCCRVNTYLLMFVCGLLCAVSFCVGVLFWFVI